jgi:hypothetical protein
MAEEIFLAYTVKTKFLREEMVSIVVPGTLGGLNFDYFKLFCETVVVVKRMPVL